MLDHVLQFQVVELVATHMEDDSLVLASGLDEAPVACGGVSWACQRMLDFQRAVPIGLKASRMFPRADGILLEGCVGLAMDLPPPRPGF